MISDGGIHSFLPHLWDLLEMAKIYKIREIYIHAITDGRDVGERSAKIFIKQIEDKKIGKIASIGGRFFAMDRDNNWDRIKKAYDVLVGKTEVSENPAKNSSNFPPDKGARGVVDEFYESSDKSDYYLPPTLLDKNGIIQENDVVICFNYRIDRMRQLWTAFCDENFAGFSRNFRLNPQNLGVFGSYYSEAVQIYKEDKNGVKNTLGEIISRENLDQLRISETEKFNHVTFYFSGGRKEKFAGEERLLIPSPKCASYAEKPGMSAVEQTDALLQKIAEKDFSLIVQNFANPDLVGHSGDLEAAKKAIEIVDDCLTREIPRLLGKNYSVIITADHGNSDEMLYPNGKPCASHTKNLVPLWILENSQKNKLELNDSKHVPSLNLNFSRSFDLTDKTGTLADIAPTILKLLEIKKPAEMTGKSLV
jgi:2,3-bisphosphoglycerate-independent phosphoglycerate mutase